MVMCVVVGSLEPIPPTAVYKTTLVSGSTGTTHTFTGVPFGATLSAAAIARGVSTPARNIFVGIAAGANVTSVTIGGVAATLVVSSTYTRLYRAVVSTGTSGTLVVTQSVSSGQSVSVWSAYDVADTVPFDTSTGSGGINSSLTLSIPLNTPANGIVIGYAIVATPSILPTLSWSGLAEDGRVPTATEIYAAASNEAVPAQTSRPVSVAFTGEPGSICAALAASFS